MTDLFTRKLIDFMAKAKFGDIPPPAVKAIKELILDDIGCAFGGYYMKPLRNALVNYCKDVGGTPESSIIGDGTKTSCALAAGVNAQFAFALDFDETGPGVHVGSSIVENAIAVAEKVGASGKEVIAAVATGYEISGRFDEAGRRHVPSTDAARHIPMTNALVAGKLLGLDGTQMNNALGIAWVNNGVLSFDRVVALMGFRPSPMVGDTNFWWTQRGIEAALLSENGFQGPLDILDDEKEYDGKALTSDTEPYWYTQNLLELKPWPMSRLTHANMENMRRIMNEEKLKPEDVEEVIFRGAKFYTVYPFNSPDLVDWQVAVLSVPWGLSMVALDIPPGTAWIDTRRFKDQTALAFARKVKMEELPEATKRWDSKEFIGFPNELEVRAKGRIFKRSTKDLELGLSLGSPRRPMPRKMSEAKFLDQVKRTLPEGQARELLSVAYDLENLTNVKDLTKLYRPK